MTRQEIEKRAVALDEEYDWTPMHESVHLISRHLTALALATLEEAARAVCPDCEQDNPAERISLGLWVHYEKSGDDYTCEASRIHDLIAALKPKEGA